MTFRYARHTTDLGTIEKFYTEIVGLEKTGGFENHNHYDGIFLGLKNADWHLEFTRSADQPQHKSDEDDALVFYLDAPIELEQIRKKISVRNINTEVPKNPYWAEHGIMIADPDGFKVIFSVRQPSFTAKDDLTNLVRSKGITHWGELIEFTRNLPYGRNSNREDFSLVIQENKGTCSAKHAFLKKIADLNNFNNVQLVVGMYRMHKVNTPKIGNTLAENGLAYIPEAHCYLRLNNQRIDVTTPDADIEHLTGDIFQEFEIAPEQVNTFKVDFHKNYLKNWIKENGITLGFDRIWEIREQCIKKLEA